MIQDPCQQYPFAHVFPAPHRPETQFQGLNSLPLFPIMTQLTGPGSRSVRIQRGTTRPFAYSLKYTSIFSSWKRGWACKEPSSSTPCSSVIVYQNLVPIWLPHCPTWTLTISLILLLLDQITPISKYQSISQNIFFKSLSPHSFLTKSILINSIRTQKIYTNAGHAQTAETLPEPKNTMSKKQQPTMSRDQALSLFGKTGRIPSSKYFACKSNFQMPEEQACIEEIPLDDEPTPKEEEESIYSRRSGQEELSLQQLSEAKMEEASEEEEYSPSEVVASRNQPYQSMKQLQRRPPRKNSEVSKLRSCLEYIQHIFPGENLAKKLDQLQSIYENEPLQSKPSKRREQKRVEGFSTAERIQQSGHKTMSKQQRVACSFIAYGYGMKVVRSSLSDIELGHSLYNGIITSIIKGALRKMVEMINSSGKKVPRISGDQENLLRAPMISCRQWLPDDQLDTFFSLIRISQGIDKSIQISLNSLSKLHSSVMQQCAHRVSWKNEKMKLKKRKEKVSSRKEVMEELNDLGDDMPGVTKEALDNFAPESAYEDSS